MYSLKECSWNKIERRRPGLLFRNGLKLLLQPNQHLGQIGVLASPIMPKQVYVPPCLLSEFASQYSDPFLCAGNRNRKTGNRNTGNSTGPSGLAAPETEMVAPLHVEVPNLAPKPEPDME